MTSRQPRRYSFSTTKKRERGKKKDVRIVLGYKKKDIYMVSSGIQEKKYIEKRERYGRAAISLFFFF